MSNKLIFLHLPKCGGTTFHSILERMYRKEEIFDIKVINDLRLNIEDFISLPPNEKARLKLLKGHMEFGLHKHFSEESTYITFLRDPIERIISYYYFVKRHPNHRLYKLNLLNDEMSFYDFVTTIKEGDVHNGQIRLISGINDEKEFMLERALENIEKHFSFVGTLEKFDESLILLQRLFDWSTPYYEIANKTKERPKISDFDQETIEAIKALNAEDIFLHKKISEELDIRLRNEASLEQKVLQLHTKPEKPKQKRKFFWRI